MVRLVSCWLYVPVATLFKPCRQYLSQSFGCCTQPFINVQLAIICVKLYLSSALHTLIKASLTMTPVNTVRGKYLVGKILANFVNSRQFAKFLPPKCLSATTQIACKSKFTNILYFTIQKLRKCAFANILPLQIFPAYGMLQHGMSCYI